MGDDIRAGDVVVCVDANPPRPSEPRKLNEGALYRVDRSGIGALTGKQIVGLREMPDCMSGFFASRFRKLDAAEDCFTKAMQELRPLETIREIHRCRDEVGTNDG